MKWGLGSIFLFLFFLLFYKIVPNERLTFRDVWPGALLSAIGWQVVSLLFADYVSTVNYTRLYGQLSGIIVLVFWFYLTAVVILLSGLLIAEVRNARTLKVEKKEVSRCRTILLVDDDPNILTLMNIHFYLLKVLDKCIFYTNLVHITLNYKVEKIAKPWIPLNYILEVCKVQQRSNHNGNING